MTHEERPNANGSVLIANFTNQDHYVLAAITRFVFSTKHALSHSTKVVPPASLLHFRVDNA